MYDSVPGWKDGLVIKSICCFCRGPDSVSSATWWLTTIYNTSCTSHFCRHQAYLWYTYVHASKTLTDKMKSKIKKFKQQKKFLLLLQRTHIRYPAPTSGN